MIKEGWPSIRTECPQSVLNYWTFKEDLSVEDGIIYKGRRLIMPETEREGTLKILHEGHYSTSKMLLRAKDSVYWPGITKDIETTAERYHACTTNPRSQQKETLKLLPAPEVAWDSLATDIFHVNNKNFILIVDYYSRFPVVHQIHSMTSRVLVRLFTEIFSEFGFPKSIVSDGGTQFTSQEFKEFTKYWQIDHYVSSNYQVINHQNIASEGGN